MLERIISFLYLIPAAMIAITLHEVAHGYMAYWLGDPTAKDEGRLSLNPLKHFDLFGLICLVFFRVGYAKPVNITPIFFKKPKLGIALVSLAGPLINFIVAIESLFLYVLLYRFNSVTIVYIINKFLLYLGLINIGLGLFNLIPIPPLDGSKIFGVILPDNVYAKYITQEKVGISIVILLLLLNYASAYITQSGTFFSIVVEYIYTGIINIFAMIFY